MAAAQILLARGARPKVAEKAANKNNLAAAFKTWQAGAKRYRPQILLMHVRHS